MAAADNAVGQPASLAISMAVLTPSTMPIEPADQRERHRLDQELREDVAAARADRHAQADFARALGDRHQHDVHDADAADHERHGSDRGEQDREHLRLASCAARPPTGCARKSRPPGQVAACGAGAGIRASAARRWRCPRLPHLDGDRTDVAGAHLLAAEHALACRRIGISTTSSWSWPIMLWPLRSRSPTITCGTLRMRIVWPTGSASPNRASATVCPTSTTLTLPSTSAPVIGRARRHLPFARFQVVRRHAEDLVDQLLLPNTTWPRRAAAVRRPRSRRPRAAWRGVVLGERELRARAHPRAAGGDVAGSTMMRFEPRLLDLVLDARLRARADRRSSRSPRRRR
jgi:hypothetical protein